MLRACGSVSRDIRRDRRCELSRPLGSSPCDIAHDTGEYDLFRALGSVSCDITHETGARQEYDLIRAMGSTSADNTHETGGTICYGHWILCL